MGRSDCEKDQFYNKMASTWDLQNLGEMILDLGHFNGHVEGWINGFEGVRDGYGIVKKNVEGKRLLKFMMKRSCV